MAEKKFPGIDRLKSLVEDNRTAIEQDPVVKERLGLALGRLDISAENITGEEKKITGLLDSIASDVELLGAADLEKEDDRVELQKQLERIKENVSALLADLEALETERLELAVQAATASVPPEQHGGGTLKSEVVPKKEKGDGNLPVEDPFLRSVFEKKRWVVRLDAQGKKSVFKHNADTREYEEIFLTKILAAVKKEGEYADESGKVISIDPLDRGTRVKAFFGIGEEKTLPRPAKSAPTPGSVASSASLGEAGKGSAGKGDAKEKKESPLSPRVAIEHPDAFFGLDAAAQVKAISSFAADGDIDPEVRFSALEKLKSDVRVSREIEKQLESSIEQCKGLVVADLGRTIEKVDKEIDGLSRDVDRATDAAQTQIREQIEQKERIFLEKARVLERFLVNHLLNKKNAQLAEIAATILCRFCADESIASIKKTVEDALKGKGREDVAALQSLLKKFESAPAAGAKEEPVETLSQEDADEAALDLRDLQRNPRFKATDLGLAEQKRYVQAIYQTKKYTNAQKLVALKLFIDTRPGEGGEESLQRVVSERFAKLSTPAIKEISAAVRRCGDRLSALRTNDSLSEVQRVSQRTALQIESFSCLQQIEKVFLYLPKKDRETAALAAVQAGYYGGDEERFIENLEGQKTAGYGDAAEVDRLIALCRKELDSLRELEKDEAAAVPAKKAVPAPKPATPASTSTPSEPPKKGSPSAPAPTLDAGAPAPVEDRPKTRKQEILEYYSSAAFLALQPKEQAEGLVSITEDNGISRYEKFVVLKSIFVALPEGSQVREVASKLTIEQGKASIENHVQRIERYEKSNEPADQEKVTGSIKSLRRFTRDLEAPPEVAMHAIRRLEYLKRSFKRSARIYYEDKVTERETSPLEKKHAKELLALLDLAFPDTKPKRAPTTPDVAAPLPVEKKRVLENDEYLRDPELLFDLTVSEQKKVMDNLMRERHEKSSEVLNFLHVVSLESIHDRSDWGKTIRRLYNTFKNELASTFMGAASGFESRVSSPLDTASKEEAKRNLTISLNRLSGLLRRHFLFDKHREKREEIMKFFLQKGEINQFKSFKESLEDDLNETREDFDTGESDLAESTFLRFQENIEWCIRRLEHKISILENPGVPRPPAPAPDASRGLPLDELTDLGAVIEYAVDNGDRNTILSKKRDLLARMAVVPDHVLEMLNRSIRDADQTSILNCAVGEAESEQRLIDYITGNTSRFPELSESTREFAINHARETGNRYVLEEAKSVYELGRLTTDTRKFLTRIDAALATTKTLSESEGDDNLSEEDEAQGPGIVDRIKQFTSKFSLSRLFAKRRVDPRTISPQFLPEPSRGTVATEREQRALDVLFQTPKEEEGGGKKSASPRKGDASVGRERDRERPKPPLRSARSAAFAPARSATSAPSAVGSERKDLASARAVPARKPERPANTRTGRGSSLKQKIMAGSILAALGGGAALYTTREKEPPKQERITPSPSPTPEPSASPEASMTPVVNATVASPRPVAETPTPSPSPEKLPEAMPDTVVGKVELLRTFDGWEGALSVNQIAAPEDMRIFPADKKGEVRNNVQLALEHSYEKVGIAFSDPYRAIVNETMGQVITNIVTEKRLPQDFLPILKAEIAYRAYEKSSTVDRERGGKKSPDILRSSLDESGKRDFDLRQFTKEVERLSKNSRFLKELSTQAERYATLLPQYHDSVEGVLLIQEINTKDNPDKLLPNPALLKSKADMLGFFARITSDGMTPPDTSLSNARQREVLKIQDRASKVTKKPLALLLGAKSFESSN